MEFFGDVFGGLMVMLFIFGFFLVVLWFILPFVVFAMKGKLDSAHLLLENIDRRLAAIEDELRAAGHPAQSPNAPEDAPDNPLSPAPPTSSAE
jgi:hypothetical protein